MGQNNVNDNVIRPAQWRTPDPAPEVSGSAALAWGPDLAEVRTPDPADVAEVRTSDPGPRTPDPAEVRTLEVAEVRTSDRADLADVADPGPRTPARWRLPEVDLGGLLDTAGRWSLWCAIGGLVVVPDAVGRWVWQPGRARALADQRAAERGLARQVRDAVKSLDHSNPGQLGQVQQLQRQRDHLVDTGKRERRELRSDRLIRGGVLVVGGGAGGFLGVPALFEWLPWWGEGGLLTAAVSGATLLGRAWWMRAGGEMPVDRVVDAPDMPTGLRLEASDRGALATLQEGLNEVKARAVAGQVVERGPWGYAFAVRSAKKLTAAQLDELAHTLDVRRGGLIVTPGVSTQGYEVRTILRDLLDEGQAPPEIPPGWTVTQPAPLVRAYDGSTVAVPLIDSMLFLGTTGSGKSTAQREVLRWLAGRAHLVGIDLVGGADLSTFGRAMHEGVFGGDLVRAERVLRFLVALIEDRTRRLTESGVDEWTEDMGRPWILAVDEYWSLTQHKTLLTLVESLIVSGRKVWVRLIGANNRRNKDLMRSTVTVSQIDTVWLFAMSPDDEGLLPSDWRAGGARPATLRPGKVGDPRDAGKSYGVTGGETKLVRWAPGSKEQSRQVAARAGAPALDEHDARVWQQFVGGGDVPRLLALIREAIVTHSAGRDVPRASVAEIAAHCTKHGVPLAVTGVTAELTRIMGRTYRPLSRDMNFEPGKNPKGLRLDEFDRCVADWLSARRDAR